MLGYFNSATIGSFADIIRGEFSWVGISNGGWLGKLFFSFFLLTLPWRLGRHLLCNMNVGKPEGERTSSSKRLG